MGLQCKNLRGASQVAVLGLETQQKPNQSTVSLSHPQIHRDRSHQIQPNLSPGDKTRNRLVQLETRQDPNWPIQQEFRVDSLSSLFYMEKI